MMVTRDSVMEEGESILPTTLQPPSFSCLWRIGIMKLDCGIAETMAITSVDDGVVVQLALLVELRHDDLATVLRSSHAGRIILLLEEE